MDRPHFEQLVEESLKRIPPALRQAMDNLAILIEDWPAPDLMEEIYGDRQTYVYGLFSGTPLTERHVDDSGDLPSVIYIYQDALEADFLDPAELRQEITITLVHEIAHFMGLDEDQIESLGYG
ncbi:MAG: metallopeptidase family protein [Gemmatimonadetes bacterium]|nr:metallopeptidase family protein [Gemmatimonadota bacterium]MBT6145353.1 metallopeptidase family protein [Gemmatimonadota bacterium]MBT7862274.1 metallopeptidase family protein [Gemmatimonadota bacterium]